MNAKSSFQPINRLQSNKQEHGTPEPSVGQKKLPSVMTYIIVWIKKNLNKIMFLKKNFTCKFFYKINLKSYNHNNS